MHRLLFLMVTALLIVSAFSCTPEEPAEKDADAYQNTAASDPYRFDDTPGDAAVKKPGKDPGIVTGTEAGDGMTTTTMENNTLQEFVRGVITNDMELLKERVTGEAAGDLDKVIADLGFREFVENDDYDALWEKIEPVSIYVLTGLSTEQSTGIWGVTGKEVGLKDMQVQVELIMEDGILKVSSYQVMTSE